MSCCNQNLGTGNELCELQTNKTFDESRKVITYNSTEAQCLQTNVFIMCLPIPTH